MQVNRDEVIEEKGPLFEVDYHSILLSLWVGQIFPSLGKFGHNVGKVN